MQKCDGRTGSLEIVCHRNFISCEETIPTFQLNTKKLGKMECPGNNSRGSCWRGLQPTTDMRRGVEDERFVGDGEGWYVDSWLGMDVKQGC